MCNVLNDVVTAGIVECIILLEATGDRKFKSFMVAVGRDAAGYSLGFQHARRSSWRNADAFETDGAAATSAARPGREHAIAAYAADDHEPEGECSSRHAAGSRHAAR